MKFVLLSLLLGVFAIPALASPPKPQPEVSAALQAARRAAYLENTGNLPSRGLAVGTRAVQRTQKRKPQKTVAIKPEIN